MTKKSVLICTLAVVGISVACSQGTPAPPAPSTLGPTEVGPDGSTLKVGAPPLTGPANGSQLQGAATLSWGAVNGKFKTFAVTYQVEVRNSTFGTVTTLGPMAATSTTASNLAFDTPYTWRVRVFLNSQQFGPWSETGNFRTQPGAYIDGDEIRDPLHTGTTVGQRFGNTSFVPGQGIQLHDNSSYVMYQLPINVLDGEYSFMATNVDEGNPGDKSKVMSMGESPHDDVTDNDYRMTLEVRGRDYQGVPGTVSFRIICGIPDNHSDSDRSEPQWTRSEWYFFKMWWKTSSEFRAGYEIRRGGPNGPIHDEYTVDTDTRAYRPSPWMVYIGAPGARGGPGNATHAGMIVRDLWVSDRTRPDFGFPAAGGAASLLSLLKPAGK